MIRSSARQLELRTPTWGGRREGAGRKPLPEGKRRVSHLARERFEKATPAHVTLRVAPHVWNLRSARSFRRIVRAFAAHRGRYPLRLIEFTVQGNHLHLVVEADSNLALSRGMQGLAIRIARALNAMMNRQGRVFADHYHSRLLRTPTELARAIAYVLGNAAHHSGRRNADPFASSGIALEVRARALEAPQTRLLRIGWRRAKPAPEPAHGTFGAPSG
jgi:REP element-mobilizing transposase RayT